MAEKHPANNKKKDLLLAVIILTVAAAGFLINHLIHQKPAARLEIQVDGQVIASYDLDQDLDTVITGYQGGTNHLIIQDHTAWVSEASCPDKVCIHQGKIQLNGQMVVCLPNRMIAMIVEEEAN